MKFFWGLASPKSCMSDFWKILNGMNLLFFIDKNNSVQNFDIYNAQRQAHKVFI